MAIDALNNTPNPKEKFLLTPMDKFSNTIVATKNEILASIQLPGICAQGETPKHRKGIP